MHRIRNSLFALVLVLTAFGQCPADDANSATPFLGSWAFELPDGNPAWLQIRQEDNTLSGSLLWSVGSARPVQDLSLQDGALTFLRKIRWKPYGRSDDTRVISKPMTATLAGDRLCLIFYQTAADGGDDELNVLTGKRMPPMPPRPDLNGVEFGKPIQLFNGRDLMG